METFELETTTSLLGIVYPPESCAGRVNPRGLRVPATIGVRGGRGLNLLWGGRRIKILFVLVTECWLNASESDMSRKKGCTFLCLRFFKDFRWFWNEPLDKLPLAMKHVACVFSSFPWQVRMWDGNSAARVGRDYGAAAGKIFQILGGAGRH